MADQSIRERIQAQAQKAMFQRAFFRWESAALISGTLLLTVFLPQPFQFWPWWGWLVMGLVSEIAVVVSSLTDRGEQQRVIEALFRETYTTAGIRDRDLREKLGEAEQYRLRIQGAVAQQPAGLLRDRLVETTSQIYDWAANMVRLARRIDAYRSDDVIQRDQQAVPREIRDLQARLNTERDPQVRAQIQTTLDSKQQFLANLQELAARMERADLQLDHSLAALGTVYSQTLLIGSKDVDSARADRLRDDIRSEVLALGDLVSSLNEVYAYQSQNMRPSDSAAGTNPGAGAAEAESATDPARRQQVARR